MEYGFMGRRKEREKRGGGRGGPTLEKEEGFQFQTSQGMNGKTGIPGEKKTLVGCSENPILALMRVSLPSKFADCVSVS